MHFLILKVIFSLWPRTQSAIILTLVSKILKKYPKPSKVISLNTNLPKVPNITIRLSVSSRLTSYTKRNINLYELTLGITSITPMLI